MSRLVLLHGFWGQGCDWNLVVPSLSSHFCRDQVLAPNLLAPSSPEVTGFINWAENFNNWVESQINEPATLVGYSMGGRLALHLLMQRPQLWKRAVLVSTRPGLWTENEKQMRLKADQLWAKRFLCMDWAELEAQWNDQPVFAKTSSTQPRQQSLWDRHKLSRALSEWSLAKHELDLQALQELAVPLLWVAGENDQKFVNIYNNLQSRWSEMRVTRLAEAGHRVPWDQPEALARAILEFS